MLPQVFQNNQIRLSYLIDLLEISLQITQLMGVVLVREPDGNKAATLGLAKQGKRHMKQGIGAQ
jgi:hypothetical protein